jgi:hypothetical protein
MDSTARRSASRWSRAALTLWRRPSCRATTWWPRSPTRSPPP